MNIVSNILFYVIWLPVCLILVACVMLWAILQTCYNHIVCFIKKIFK